MGSGKSSPQLVACVQYPDFQHRIDFSPILTVRFLFMFLFSFVDGLYFFFYSSSSSLQLNVFSPLWWVRSCYSVPKNPHWNFVQPMHINLRTKVLLLTLWLWLLLTVRTNPCGATISQSVGSVCDFNGVLWIVHLVKKKLRAQTNKTVCGCVFLPTLFSIVEFVSNEWKIYMRDLV